MNFVGVKHNIVEKFALLGIISKRNKRDFFPNDWSKSHIIPNESRLNVSSTNNVIELWIKGNKYYLRLIEEHVSKKDFLSKLLYKYECLLDRDLPSGFKAQVIHNGKLFMQMGYLDDFSSDVYQFFKSNNPKVFGVELEDDAFSLDDLKAFIHFAWSEITSYRKNMGCGIWQTYNYNRCRCQEVLYKCFGVERLICKTCLVKVNIGGYDCYGYIMKEAGGENPLNNEGRHFVDSYSNKLLNELNILNFMDVLCYERDHRPGNYNIIFNQILKKYVSAEAFDNDSDFAFFPTSSVKKSFVGSSPVIGLDGLINRSLYDAGFISRILSVNDEEIKTIAEPYLNCFQLYFLLRRFHKIQEATKKTIEFAPEKLKCNSTKRVIQEGMGYFDVLQNWKETDKDPVLLSQQQFGRINMNHNKIKIWPEVSW